MIITDEIERMEASVREVGLTIKALCEHADVNQSTWTRWKSGLTAPNTATWGRVVQAFDHLMLGATQAKAS